MEGNEAVVIPMQKEKKEHHLSSLLLKVEKSRRSLETSGN
jgi:hypothetical protein